MVAVTRPFADSIAETHDLETWSNKLTNHYCPEEATRIRTAIEWAKISYAGKTLAITQEAIFSHAIASAAIMVELRMDCETVCATLLFSLADYIPDYTDAIASKLGPAIADLAKGVNQIRKIAMLAQPKNVKPHEMHEQIEAMRKMLLAMVEDIRVVLIQLAWRTQTMHYLHHCSPIIQQTLAQETLDIFAPLANRLGIWQIKWELEDLSFRFLKPEFYKKIAKLLDERRVSREEFIGNVLSCLRVALDEASVHAHLMGRPKHIYSIYKKMQKKNLDFSDLYDIRAVRILVNDVKECYTALSVVHDIWQPIPGEFDDYIAHPKGNDYRSLHTAVIGPDDKAVEIQIRTVAMHDHAEYGVAAHWRYKEGGSSSAQYEKKIAWMRQLLDWREELHHGETLAGAFNVALFDDTIYVLTPAGKVVTLPAGATPIDFAYHVHTELGHRCRGAKVNGSIVPLRTPLKNGQRVEIITVKEGSPSIDWLHQGYLKSPRALAKVRHWLKQQNVDIAIETGRTLFEREAVKAGISHPNIDHIAEIFKCKTTEDFFAAVGQSELSLRDIHQALQDTHKSSEIIHERPPITAENIVREARANACSTGILVEGIEELMTLLAKCCKPVPPDPILGFITKGRGISVHRATCGCLKRLEQVNPERMIKVSWGVKQAQVFAVDLSITAIHRPTLLRDLSEVFARQKINVTGVNTTGRDHRVKLHFTIEIPTADNLAVILNRLKEVANVLTVARKM